VALSRENRVGPQKTAQNLRGAVCDLRATQLGGGTRWGSPENRAARLRKLDGWFEHQNAVHRRRWGMSPCRFKRQLMEEATETSVYSTMSSGKLR
jgi:hypothetical protein